MVLLGSGRGPLRPPAQHGLPPIAAAPSRPDVTGTAAAATLDAMLVDYTKVGLYLMYCLADRFKVSVEARARQVAEIGSLYLDAASPTAGTARILARIRIRAVMSVVNEKRRTSSSAEMGNKR